MLVRFDDVSRSYGAFDVLRGVSFQIDPGQKIGLIGANGSGKTTILDLIEHPEDADRGQVVRRRGLRTGALAQHPEFREPTVLDEALATYSHLQELEHRLGDLETRMRTEDDPALFEAYSDLQHGFEHQGGYTYRARTEAALSGLGFSRHQFRQDPASLSGGEKNRLALARLLLADVGLFILDEPTNHLDIRSIEWLERFLRTTDTAILLVSHDRLFLDRIVGGILELEQGHLREYRGNYSAYLKQREAHRERQRKLWKKQQDEIGRAEEYIRKNIAGQKTRQAQSRRKALARMERIERPSETGPGVRFRFSSTGRSPRQVLRARDLDVGYDPERPVLGSVALDVEKGERLAILGANGSGKTTLLAALAGRRSPLAGNVERPGGLAGYYDQELADLRDDGSVLDELRDLDSAATDGELRGFLAGFLFRGEAVYKQTRDLSGGERSRLALARLVFQAPLLLALDEPTNHLDIASREALEAALIEYPGTLLFVTHDRRLAERVATRILYLEGGKVSPFDSFAEFEQQLFGEADPEPPSGPRAKAPSKAQSTLSKNQKQQIERDIGALESAIGEAEQKIHEIEASFETPPPDLDWGEAHQRYRRLQQDLEALYRDLAALTDQVG